ncbi:MAG: hypothetical protein WC373_08510 [Smithella sp.]
MRTITLVIQNYESRKQLVYALAEAGYMVTTKSITRISSISTEHYVIFEVEDNKVTEADLHEKENPS